MKKYASRKGFTLIETLVALMLLSVAIVGPMTLTTKSLAAAQYARDQITAFYLAQEALEAVRSIRDGNILQIAQGTSGLPDTFEGIPLGNKPFIIDARAEHPETTIVLCVGLCPLLETDKTLYGYDSDPLWTNTNFTRTVLATTVWSDGVVPQEIRVTVNIKWKTGAFKVREFTLSQNFYRWIKDNATQL